MTSANDSPRDATRRKHELFESLLKVLAGRLPEHADLTVRQQLAQGEFDVAFWFLVWFIGWNRLQLPQPELSRLRTLSSEVDADPAEWRGIEVLADDPNYFGPVADANVTNSLLQTDPFTVALSLRHRDVMILIALLSAAARGKLDLSEVGVGLRECSSLLDFLSDSFRVPRIETSRYMQMHYRRDGTPRDVSLPEDPAAPAS